MLARTRLTVPTHEVSRGAAGAVAFGRLRSEDRGRADRAGETLPEVDRSVRDRDVRGGVCVWLERAFARPPSPVRGLFAEDVPAGVPVFLLGELWDWRTRKSDAPPPEGRGDLPD